MQKMGEEKMGGVGLFDLQEPRNKFLAGKNIGRFDNSLYKKQHINNREAPGGVAFDLLEPRIKFLRELKYPNSYPNFTNRPSFLR